MDSYSWLKLLHILSAVVVAGTGAGIAFFMLMAYRSKNQQAIAVVTRHVVLADWLFTTPAIVIQLVTGLLLVKYLGWSFNSPWFFWVCTLYIFIGCCWLPVVIIQYQLRNLAREAELPQDRFRNLMRWWSVLGCLAFSAVLAIFWLMVFKPLPVI